MSKEFQVFTRILTFNFLPLKAPDFLGANTVILFFTADMPSSPFIMMFTASDGLLTQQNSHSLDLRVTTCFYYHPSSFFPDARSLCSSQPPLQQHVLNRYPDFHSFTLSVLIAHLPTLFLSHGDKTGLCIPKCLLVDTE